MKPFGTEGGLTGDRLAFGMTGRDSRGDGIAEQFQVPEPMPVARLVQAYSRTRMFRKPTMCCR